MNYLLSGLMVRQFIAVAKSQAINVAIFTALCNIIGLHKIRAKICAKINPLFVKVNLNVMFKQIVLLSGYDFLCKCLINQFFHRWLIF